MTPTADCRDYRLTEKVAAELERGLELVDVLGLCVSRPGGVGTSLCSRRD